MANEQTLGIRTLLLNGRSVSITSTIIFPEESNASQRALITALLGGKHSVEQPSPPTASKTTEPPPTNPAPYDLEKAAPSPKRQVHSITLNILLFLAAQFIIWTFTPLPIYFPVSTAEILGLDIHIAALPSPAFFMSLLGPSLSLTSGWLTYQMWEVLEKWRGRRSRARGRPCLFTRR